MYKLLRARAATSYKSRGVAENDWRRCTPLAKPPTRAVAVTFETEPHVLDFYWGIPPLFSEALLGALEPLGPTNLDAYDATITWQGNVGDKRRGWRLINVLGEVSLAQFVLDLPDTELATIKGSERVLFETLRPALAARAVKETGPTPPIARLAEWNKPLIIRADLAKPLASFTNLDFLGVLDAWRYTGASLADYVEQAAGTALI